MCIYVVLWFGMVCIHSQFHADHDLSYLIMHGYVTPSYSTAGTQNSGYLALKFLLNIYNKVFYNLNQWHSKLILIKKIGKKRRGGNNTVKV